MTIRDDTRNGKEAEICTFDFNSHANPSYRSILFDSCKFREKYGGFGEWVVEGEVGKKSMPMIIDGGSMESYLNTEEFERVAEKEKLKIHRSESTAYIISVVKISDHANKTEFIFRTILYESKSMAEPCSLGQSVITPIILHTGKFLIDGGGELVLNEYPRRTVKVYANSSLLKNTDWHTTKTLTTNKKDLRIVISSLGKAVHEKEQLILAKNSQIQSMTLQTSHFQDNLEKNEKLLQQQKNIIKDLQIQIEQNEGKSKALHEQLSDLKQEIDIEKQSKEELLAKKQKEELEKSSPIIQCRRTRKRANRSTWFLSYNNVAVISLAEMLGCWKRDIFESSTAFQFNRISTTENIHTCRCHIDENSEGRLKELCQQNKVYIRKWRDPSSPIIPNQFKKRILLNHNRRLSENTLLGYQNEINKKISPNENYQITKISTFQKQFKDKFQTIFIVNFNLKCDSPVGKNEIFRKNLNDFLDIDALKENQIRAFWWKQPIKNKGPRRLTDKSREELGNQNNPIPMPKGGR